MYACKPAAPMILWCARNYLLASHQLNDIHQSYLNYKFSSGAFWTHKFKTKAKIQKYFQHTSLLSTPDSVPHAEPVLASFAVESQ